MKMKFSNKKYFLAVLLIILSFSCSSLKTAIEDGKYVSRKRESFSSRVFLKIEKDTAIVNMVCPFKTPEHQYTDTVILKQNIKQEWQGKKTKIFLKNNKLFISAPIFDLYGNVCHNITRSMKLNKYQYDKYLNLYKNRTLFFATHKYLCPYSDTRRREIYNRISEKYEIYSKLRLNHQEFLIIFEKFEQELIRELELLKEQYD